MSGNTTRSEAWKTAITVVQEVHAPHFPEGAHAMTIVVEFPPGDPALPAPPLRTRVRLRAGRRDAVRTRRRTAARRARR